MVWRARSNHTRPVPDRVAMDPAGWTHQIRKNWDYNYPRRTLGCKVLWCTNSTQDIPRYDLYIYLYLGGKFQRLSVRLFHSSHMPYPPHNIRRKLCPLCPVDPMLADETNVRQWNTDVGQITCNKNICWLKSGAWQQNSIAIMFDV